MNTRSLAATAAVLLLGAGAAAQDKPDKVDKPDKPEKVEEKRRPGPCTDAARPMRSGTARRRPTCSGP